MRNFRLFLRNIKNCHCYILRKYNPRSVRWWQSSQLFVHYTTICLCIFQLKKFSISSSSLRETRKKEFKVLAKYTRAHSYFIFHIYTLIVYSELFTLSYLFAPHTKKLFVCHWRSISFNYLFISRTAMTLPPVYSLKINYLTINFSAKHQKVHIQEISSQNFQFYPLWIANKSYLN